jgi:hypothetical protein
MSGTARDIITEQADAMTRQEGAELPCAYVAQAPGVPG